MEDLKTQIIAAQSDVISALHMLTSEMGKVNKSDKMISYWQDQIAYRKSKLEKLSISLHNLINNPVWI